MSAEWMKKDVQDKYEFGNIQANIVLKDSMQGGNNYTIIFCRLYKHICLSREV